MKTKNKNIDPLENILLKLKYKFKDKNILKLALTHSSFVEKNSNENYERLEFLGDRVLGLVIAEMLFKKFPNEKEGELSKRFAYLVNKKTLIKVADLLGLRDVILTAKNYRLRVNITDSMVADSLEALIGAIFLDSNFENVKNIIERLWEFVIKTQNNPPNDPKSVLQEWCLRKNKNLPEYKIINKTGPDHKPIFKVKLNIDGYLEVFESGPSKQEAEIKAAEKLISKLSIDELKS